MRDVDERHRHVVLDHLQLELHLLAQLEVERAERLVQQQDARPVDERAGERDALLLPAGELPRLPPLGPGEPDDLEDLENASAHLVARHAPALEPERDVLEHVEVREEGVALEDRVDVALVRRQARHLPPAEVDDPFVRLLEPADHPERRRLAAARRAEQRVEAPVLDLERDVVDRNDVVEALRDPLEADV